MEVVLGWLLTVFDWYLAQGFWTMAMLAAAVAVVVGLCLADYFGQPLIGVLAGDTIMIMYIFASYKGAESAELLAIVVVLSFLAEFLIIRYRYEQPVKPDDSEETK